MAPGSDVPAETAADTASANGLLSRDLLLAATVRDEEEIDVPGLGRLLVGEISGEERAQIIERQAANFQEKRVDVRGYQKALLVAGVLDPKSPAGSRAPLLQAGDADAVMKLGAGKVTVILAAIERLSGMGAAAVERAEGNSVATPSASFISV